MNLFSDPSPYPLDRYRSSFLLLFLCVLTQISSVFAQESGVGTITGRVTNKATGSFLPGAIISVEGSSAVAIASRDGTFTLSVPAGTRTLIANFTGLDELRTPVAVAGGQTTTVDLSLTSQIYAMDPVAVTGLREGNALAIQTQRNAINSKTVAAVDTFGNPAANPGELLQRLPGITTDIVGSEVRTLYIRGMGPGFSSLMVDGDRMASSTGTSASRDYQIEQLGTGNIESVELIKAPTPDQDANAVAGYVNLISKRAFDLPERRIGAIAGTMWKIRSFDGSPFKDKPDNLDILGVSYSDVFSVLGGSNNLGIAMNVNRRVSTTTQDEIGPGALTSFSNSYVDPLSSRPLQRVFGTGDFGYDAEAHNIGLNVDYKLTPDAYVFFRFALNTNYQYQEFYRPTIGWTGATAATFTPESTYDHSEMLPVANSVGLNESAIFTKKSLNYAFSGGGEQKLFGGTSVLSIRGNYSHANINYPAYIRIQSTASGIGWRLDRTDDPWYPQFTQTSGPSLYDANSYRVRNQLRYSYKAPNDLYGGRIDFKKDFSIAVPAYVKVGVKYARDERSTDVQYSEYTFVGADGIANSADDSMAPYLAEHYRQGDGRYGPFPFTAIPNTGRKGDLMSVPQGYWTETAANAYQGYVLSNSDLKFSETISAAYVSGNIELGRLKILAGLRVEETDTSGTAQIRNTSAAWGGNSITTLTPEENRARARRSFVGPFTQK
ncbi:MAG TPA: carboxypeptidase-like regulatory domain-containing protein, partial [Opitutaceae bacterium]|nr:carboxypeptidase-like regulatory domain-containing protein [Opitutaceae bacterium]